MNDALQIIADICEDVNSIGHASSPRIVKKSDFDLSSFAEQESGIPGLTTEFVSQSGPGICGDDYHGTMAYPIGDHLFVVNYNT